MIDRLCSAVGLVALVSLMGCPSGWKLVRVEGERPSLHPAYWDAVNVGGKIDKEAAVDPVCRAYREPLIHCAYPSYTAYCRRTPAWSRDDGQTVPAREPASADDKLTSLISFVHMSDAQLKEHRIRMDGELSEAAYDGLTNGALRHPQLEKHDDAALLANVVAINQLRHVQAHWGHAFAPLPPPRRPNFVIHGGDAVDAGMFTELAQFLAVVGQLDLPLYNAVGNHDNLFFGTFPFEHMEGRNVLLPHVPIYDTDRFMRFHSPSGADADISVPSFKGFRPHNPTKCGLAFEKPSACVTKPTWRGRDGPQSNFHGFDLACYRGRADEHLCPEARGYYSFDVALPSGACARKLRIIILNTAEIVPETVGDGFKRRSRANMQPEQLRWLEHELSRPGKDRRDEIFHIVLGHHNLAAFLHEDQAKAVERMLLAAPRLLTYLSAHTHQDAMVAHPRPDGSVLWEVTTGSTLVFPQLLRLVDILEGAEHKRLYLRLTSFRQQLSDGADFIAKASTQCAGLARRAKWARDGAALDEDDNRVAEAVAVSRANGMLHVWQRKEETCPTPR